MFKLAWASLWNRRSSALLTVVAIAVSVMLLLGVERLRDNVRSSFANTISGTDLIVGARTGQVQLLLSSVFHIGNMSNTLSADSYAYIADLPAVTWTIPIALGDSVQGAPVVATNTTMFEQFQYGARKPLSFAAGVPFVAATDAVLGAQFAREHGYQVGSKLVVAHGSGGISFSQHDAHPFTVTGILAATGTPVDKAVYIPLAGLAQVHGELSSAAESPHDHDHDDHEHEHASTEPMAVTTSLSAVLVGLQAKPLALRLQRQLNTYDGEPLTAIMPGLTLQQLWQTLNVFEQALLAISALVVVTGLVGMLTSLLASLRERRREMAVLRAVGAGPSMIFGLLVSEALLLTLLGCIAGIALLYATTSLAAPIINTEFGIQLSLGALQWGEWKLLGLVCIGGLLISLWPAWRAYRNALSDGLKVSI